MENEQTQVDELSKYVREVTESCQRILDAIRLNIKSEHYVAAARNVDLCNAQLAKLKNLESR